MRKILIIFGAGLFLLFLFNLELIVYGIRQGRGQMNIILNAVPIEEYIEEGNVSDDNNRKLHFIDTVRRYAMTVLGLNESNSYKSIYDHGNDTLMWVVTGCRPYVLEEKTWTFPFAGEVPYKGFFDKSLALDELERVEREGYEGSITNPGGWSTLGWFDDPILSQMLDNSLGEIADLIIHELVHATIFIKGDVDYNENLATFIGYEGTKRFLSDNYGMDSDIYKEYMGIERDYRLFSEHVLRGAGQLEVLYEGLGLDKSDEEKKELKDKVIRDFVESIDTIDFYEKNYYDSIFVDEYPNNNFFMSFLRYRAEQGDFKKALKEEHNDNIVGYIKALKQIYEPE